MTNDLKENQLMLTNEQLAAELRDRFGYLDDNNRDLIGDPSFPLDKTVEEITAKFAVDFLVAYLVRETYDPGADDAD